MPVSTGQDLSFRPVSALNRAFAGTVALVLLALLSSTLHAGSWTLCAALLALALAAYAVPSTALVAAAVVLPFGSLLNGITSGSYPWTDPLAAAFLCGFFARRVGGRAAPRVALAAPAALLAVLALASAAVTLALVQARTEFWRPFLANLSASVLSNFFGRRLEYHALNDAVSFALAMGLAWSAAVLAHERPARAAAVARAAAGAGALIGVLSLVRLATIAGGSATPADTITHLLTNARFSPAFRDYNAAGSLFAMLLTMGVLAFPVEPVARRLAVPALALIAAGLWLTGSRTALAAAALAVILAVGIRIVAGRPGRTSRALIVAVVLLVAAGAAWATMARPRSDEARATTFRATRLRIELAATAVRMTASAPVFGVGIGEFYDRSASFSSPILRRTYARENAHNYFLQVMAELGIVGLAAFLWLLVSALRPLVRAALADTARPPLAQAFAWGIAVFLLTCLAGHPLLISEVAFSFWILVGTASGMAGAGATTRESRLPVRLAQAAAVAVLVLVPARASAAIRAADFEHLGIGLSGWRQDQGGIRYRETRGPALVFVPTGDGSVEFALRAAAPDHSPLLVDILLEDRLANRLRVDDKGWVPVSLIVPKRHRRFARLELRIAQQPVSDDEDETRLFVSKIRQVGR